MKSPPCPARRASHPWAAIGAAVGIGLAAALPAGCAEFRSMPLPLEPGPTSGMVTPGPGGVMTPQLLERALRADASRLWQRNDGGAGLSVQIKAVTWRDGALGCPQPDRLYTQALVPGWHAVVADGRREISYHASRAGYWLRCPADRVQPPLPDAATR